MRVEASIPRRAFACAWSAIDWHQLSFPVIDKTLPTRIERLLICYPLRDKQQPYLIYQGNPTRIMRSSRFLQEMLWLEIQDTVTNRRYFFILTRWQCSKRTYRRLTKLIKQSINDR